jgi:hypothetical protein
MTRLAPAALVTVLAAAAPASPAAAQSGLPTGRPHSKVVTDDRGDLRITALQMTVTRAGRRLRARVALAVRNESARSVRRELRIGCTGGEAGQPGVPRDGDDPRALGRRGAVDIVRRVTLRRPPARPDAVQAALIRPGIRRSPTPSAPMACSC